MGPGGADRKPLDQLFRIGLDGLQIQQAPAHITFVVKPRRHHVFGQRRAHRQPFGNAILRTAGKAERAPLEHTHRNDIVRPDGDPPIDHRPQPRDGFHQLGLPIALDADQPDDLARAHINAAFRIRDREQEIASLVFRAKENFNDPT